MYDKLLAITTLKNIEIACCIAQHNGHLFGVASSHIFAAPSSSLFGVASSHIFAAPFFFAIYMNLQFASGTLAFIGLATLRMRTK